MIKRFGAAPNSEIQYKFRPGAYAVLVRNRQVLLTFQEAPFSEFQLPGGGIDPVESTLPALRREIMEETGWAIGTPRRVGAYRRFVHMPDYNIWAEKICQIYFARPSLKISEPTEDGHSCHWVTPIEAMNLITNSGDKPFMKQVLRDIL